MPLYALDTDTLTLLRRHHPAVVRRVRAAPAGAVATTVITVEEQVGGWYTYIRKATRPEQVEAGYRELGEAVGFLSGVPLLHYTRAAIARFELLRSLKLNVKNNDLRIAAIALEVGGTVVTRNLRDFRRVPGLAAEDWAAPLADPPPPA